MTNCRIVECLATTAVIAPSSQAAGAVNTAGHNMALFRRRLYTLIVGAMPNGATVDMKLQASQDGATNWVDIPGVAIAQVTAANSVAQIEAYDERLIALNLGGFVRAVVTVGGGACQTSLVAQAADGRFAPASDYNLAGMPPAVLL